MIQRRLNALVVAAVVALLPWHAYADPDRPPVGQAQAISPASTNPDMRKPIPPEELRQASLVRIREIFADDYASATLPAQKRELAIRLLRQADETKDSSDRWVLLAEALRLATDVGDVATATTLIDRIPTEYAVERNASRLEWLSRLAAKVAPAQAIDLARKCLDFARSLDDAENQEQAAKAIVLGSALAKKAKDIATIAEAQRLSAKQKERQKVSKELEPILFKLASDPNASDVNLEAGKLLCLRAGRWAEGLPLLKKGSDPQLARIADMELAPPSSARDRVQAGDAWWDWAESQKGVFKSAAQAVAAKHYSTALPSTEGLDRARLEKRINTTAAVGGGTGETIVLALLREIEVTGVANGFSKNGTFNGQPFMCRGSKYPSAIFTHPSDKSTAKIVFRIPAGARRLRGIAGVFSLDNTPAGQQPGSPIVMAAVADGEVVWNSPQFTRRDQLVAFDLDIRGVVQLELHTTSIGAATTSWGAWLDPVLVK